MNNIENFENFKNRIAEIFKQEGLSENLLAEIERWHTKRQQETDMSGVASEQKIAFQLELAQIYGTTERYDQSWDVLSWVWTFADNLGNEELKKEVEKWMDTIHGKK